MDHRIVFINPFSNHSALTLYALSTYGSITVFCPPLTLQIWFGRINLRHVSFTKQRASIQMVNLILIALFIFFRLRILGSLSYISAFRAALLLAFPEIKNEPTFVYYQDYVADLLSVHFPTSRRICEIIIATDSKQANYPSTLAAINSASSVFLPNKTLLSLCNDTNASLHIAPYGGNKAEVIFSDINRLKPRNYQSSLSNYSIPLSKELIIITARSSSLRKGGDLLLGSLAILDNLLTESPYSLKLEVHICGCIQDNSLRSLYKSTTKTLSLSNQIKLSNRQYPQDEFLRLLALSDLFVMPSRLESTSLAALEALWHGVPSILTPECGVENFSSDRHGLLFDDNSPTTLANLMFFCCTDIPSLTVYRSFLQADRELFTWHRYFSAYHEVLSI